LPPTVNLPETFADTPTAPATRFRRIESVDLLRGLLMIIMALDHTRDFFSAYRITPTDPMRSWPALFLTRWVTHLCAPGFVALCGTSIYLQRHRGKSISQLSRLLVTRGLWLILVDITVVSFALNFAWAPIFEVVAAIGTSMVCLAALLRLPTAAIGSIGAVIILFHNLLDPISASRLGSFGNIWKVLHQPGFLMYHAHPFAMVAYPALPWFGIMCLGYAFGAVVTARPPLRTRVSLGLAASFAIAFVLLRLFHGYGDPFPFLYLATPARTAMSFFNLMKYPPSLQFTLATFSVLLLLFALLDTSSLRDWLPRIRNFVDTYGRVPFFYFVVHLYLIHTAVVLCTLATGGDWRFWLSDRFVWQGGFPPHWGFSLPVIYAIWLAVVLALYLPCAWFGNLKARRRDWWLSYL
jgi:uncharacterized membrane protein